MLLTDQQIISIKKAFLFLTQGDADIAVRKMRLVYGVWLPLNEDEEPDLRITFRPSGFYVYYGCGHSEGKTLEDATKEIVLLLIREKLCKTTSLT
jgi:hypothetical protein